MKLTNFEREVTGGDGNTAINSGWGDTAFHGRTQMREVLLNPLDNSSVVWQEHLWGEGACFCANINYFIDTVYGLNSLLNEFIYITISLFKREVVTFFISRNPKCGATTVGSDQTTPPVLRPQHPHGERRRQISPFLSAGHLP